MRSIAEVVRELDVTDYMLREWEKRGFFGKVAQIDGKRMYTKNQFERVKFVAKKVNEQREQDIKRTEYSKIEDALLDKFGGEVMIREAQDPVELMSNFTQKMENRDKEVQNTLQSIQMVLEGLQLAMDEAKELPAPDTSRQDGLLQSIQEMVQQSHKNEVDLEKKFENLSANYEKLADVHKNLILKLERIEEENKQLRIKKKDLEINLELEKKKKWWQRF